MLDRRFFGIFFIPLLLIGALVYFMMGAGFGAKLGMIDDHEIALFLGSDGKINLSEIPHILKTQTEIGTYGASPRYRPIYYTLRIIESMVWRTNSTLWYVSRYILFVFSLYGLWRMLTLYFPTSISYLFIGYSLTIPFWGDLMSRIGPSEIYAVGFLALFSWGIIKITTYPKPKWMDYSYLIVGYIGSVGSKENFVFLILPLVLAVGYRWLKYGFSKIELLVVTLLTLYTGWIGVEILLATNATGVDFYGTSISYPARIKYFVMQSPKMIVSRHILPSVLIAVYASVQLWKSKWKNRTDSTYLLVMITFGFAIFTQYIFYNSLLPQNSRYDFPALLIFPLINLISVKYIAGKVWPYKMYYVFFAVYLMYFIFGRGYQYTRVLASQNVERTNRYSEYLTTLSTKLKESPETPLIFVSNHYLNFEPISSTTRYLSAMGVSNPIMLAYDNDAAADENELARMLSPRLLAVVAKGGESEELFARFSPLKQLGEGQKCYSTSFAKTLSYGNCSVLATY